MVRLRRSDANGKGYTRKRSGKGWTYLDSDGNRVTNRDLRARMEGLGIPPAWTDVWIAPYENGHVQATGVDSAGRRQYIYHPTWREQKDRIKFDRALQLAESLPSARRQVTMHLRQDGFTRERALAAGFRMLDTGSLRVGSERYTESNGSHGLTTLLCSHVTVHGDAVHLEFPAKSGQEWSSDIRDPDLVKVVRGLKRRGPNARLLAYKEFTAKDFRTLHGTVAAAISLAKHGPEETKGKRQRALAQAYRDAAEVLSNTPTIAKNSYVDPRLVDEYAHGRTIDPQRLGSGETELRNLLFR
jgi:DNA topoisomerase-1